jgi:oligopeptide/dipeptide ABC transporter ATP-binding protein
MPVCRALSQRHGYLLGQSAALDADGSGARRRLLEPGECRREDNAVSMAVPILDVEDLKVHYAVRGSGFFVRSKHTLRAVDGISLQIQPGETLGLVGESGCGKSTAGRTLLRLEQPTSGAVRFEGRDLGTLTADELRALRRKMQIVFQDPIASLNPRLTIGQIISEPLSVHHLAEGKARQSRIAELLSMVELSPDFSQRYPHEFSGGQRQRIGIARAIAVEPRFIVLDEPVSALDVSIQAQILRLLSELQGRLNLSYLFIAHDLAVVGQMSDRIAVMYLGKIVEIAQRDSLYQTPHHPYTQALLSAVPVPDPVIARQRMHVPLGGEVPSPINPPSGCRFHPRCPLAQPICRTEEPLLRRVANGHQVACHFGEAAAAGFVSALA